MSRDESGKAGRYALADMKCTSLFEKSIIICAVSYCNVGLHKPQHSINSYTVTVEST